MAAESSTGPAFEPIGSRSPGSDGGPCSEDPATGPAAASNPVEKESVPAIRLALDQDGGVVADGGSWREREAPLPTPIPRRLKRGEERRELRAEATPAENARALGVDKLAYRTLMDSLNRPLDSPQVPDDLASFVNLDRPPTEWEEEDPFAGPDVKRAMATREALRAAEAKRLAARTACSGEEGAPVAGLDSGQSPDTAEMAGASGARGTSPAGLQAMPGRRPTRTRGSPEFL